LLEVVKSRIDSQDMKVRQATENMGGKLGTNGDWCCNTVHRDDKLCDYVNTSFPCWTLCRACMARTSTPTVGLNGVGSDCLAESKTFRQI